MIFVRILSGIVVVWVKGPTFSCCGLASRSKAMGHLYAIYRVSSMMVLHNLANYGWTRRS